jgi:hypothetical protein
MPDLTVLIQVGSVGAFIYYALKNNAEWRTYLSDQNGKLSHALDKVATALEKQNDKLDKMYWELSKRNRH